MILGREGKMKKKKNLKKKILGITMSTLLVCLPFVSGKVENVKADSCVDYYNYYAFATVADYNWLGSNDAEIDERFADGGVVRTTFSYFSKTLPTGVTNPNYDNVSGRWITSSYRGHNNYWTDAVLVNTILKPWVSRIGSNTPIKIDDTHYLYYHTAEWGDDATRKISSANNDPSGYTTDALIDSLLWSTTETFGTHIESFLQTKTDDFMTGGIKRTYDKAAWKAKRNAMVSGNETDNRIYEANVYEVKYQVCASSGGSDSTPNTTPTDTTKYTLTVNYIDKLGNPLADPDSLTKEANSTYSVTCPDSLKSGSYVLSSKPSNASGKMTSDVVVNCIYTSDSTKTSDIPIFIVWAVGGAALAYSIYFFRKYYKQQNEV